MSEQDQNTPKGSKPDYAAYAVRDTRDGKGFWTRIGAAWPHRDGQGFDIDLDATPTNGRICLRVMREERSKELDQQRTDRSQQQAQEQVQDRSRNYGPSY